MISGYFYVTSEGLGVNFHPLNGHVGLTIDSQDHVDLISAVCLRPIKYRRDIKTFIILLIANLTDAWNFTWNLLIRIGPEW